MHRSHRLLILLVAMAATLAAMGAGWSWDGSPLIG